MDEFSGITELAKHVEDLARVEMISTTSGATLASIPSGRELKSIKALIDEYRLTPERMKGTATALTLLSFIDMVNRAKDTSSVVFAEHSVTKEQQSASMTAVLNYNNIGSDDSAARYGDHVVKYAFPYSVEWTAWMGKNGKTMTQMEFAEFLEDRILDITDASDLSASSDPDPRKNSLIEISAKLQSAYASPTDLMEVARGLEVHAESVVSSGVRLPSGEMKISYDEKHTGADGKPLTVPSLFLIGIPVFDRGAAYRLPVRLRYRLGGGKVSWFFEVYRWQLAFDAAFEDACTDVVKATELKLFHGKPEVGSSSK